MTMTTTWHFKVGKDLWNIFVCQVNTGDGNTANTDRQTYASVRMSTIVSRTYNGTFLLLQQIHGHTDTDMQEYSRIRMSTIVSWTYNGIFLLLQLRLQIDCKYKSKVLNISLKYQASAIIFLPHTYAMVFGAVFQRCNVLIMKLINDAVFFFFKIAICQWFLVIEHFPLRIIGKAHVRILHIQTAFCR